MRVSGMSDDEASQLPLQPSGSMLAAAYISTWMTDDGGFDVLPGLVGADGHLASYEDLTQRGATIQGEGVHDPGGSAGGHHHRQGAGRPPQRPRGLPELRALRDARTTGESTQDRPT